MERFVDQHQGYPRSLGTMKTWLVWDGTRWKPSDYAEVFKFALETVQSIKAEVGQAAGLTDAQNLKKWLLILFHYKLLYYNKILLWWN